jgi:hypothetical protein
MTDTNKPSGNIIILEDKNIPIERASMFIDNMKKQNYTPFGTEFKKIISSQIFYYGQNFAVEIPVVGNILYRGFFEIELPSLNFNDNIINNIKYTEYKNNRLSNIKQELNKWTNLYTNMKNFSNIMIEVYVEANKILKLQNVTLSFLQSRVLTIINSYGETIYKYRLLIQPSILKNTDIAAYIVGLTTLNISIIMNTINIMYNNNINYLTYYYGNVSYYTTQYETVNKGQLLCRWIDHLGHYYFNYFELVVNGLTVDNYSNDMLHLYQTKNILQEYKYNYDKMIGNTEDIYTIKGTPNIIYTPLIFSFNDMSTQSLPLVSMMNSSIKINSRVNDLKNIVYLQDWNLMYTQLLTVKIRRDQHITDETNSIIPYDLPYTSVEVMIPSYIYIYNCNIVDARVLNAQYPGIDSTSILLYYGSYNENNEPVLTEEDFIYLMNNIKTDTKLSEGTKISLAGYHYFLDYNYLLNLISKPKINLLMEYGFIDNYEKQIMATNKLEYVVETHHEIILDINDTSLYDSLNDMSGLIKDIYLFGRRKTDLNGISLYGKSQYTNFDTGIIENIELKVSNEYNLFEHYNIGRDTYANVITYLLNAPLPDGVWFKTFSLHTDNVQPSGFANMNHIKGQNIAVILNQILNNLYYNGKNNPNKLGIEFKIIYTKYNIMEVNNGNLEFTFYN